MITLLGSGQNLQVAELISVTLSDGSVFTWTTAPADIVFNGITFASRGPNIKIGTIQWRVGIEVDTLKMELWCDPTVTSQLVEQTIVTQAVQYGLMDNAFVQIHRLYTANWGDWSAGAITLFQGNVSDAVCDWAHVEFDIKSRKELLDIPFPYLTYQAGCQWQLYGPGCTLNPISFGVNGTAATGSVALLINSNLTNPDHYFDEGYVTFTSGANIGLTRVVRQYLNASGQILLFIPFPNAPANGDTFTAFPGCDKQQATCQNKFNNLVNFKGMPNIPIPEAAV